MATINTTTDQIAITTKKLQDVEISESELPQTPPAEDLHTTITSVLLPQLSKTASIHLPSEELFKKYTSRWSDTTFTAPTAVVNVTAETDISAVIKFASTHNLHFLAQSGCHGLSSSLQKLNGKPHLLINLRSMNEVKVDLEAGTATLSAGAITKEVIDAAHAAKAHIVTGVCNSVGIVSALLGGGLGFLISNYGPGVDQILSARVVLASGDIVTFSAKENQDLFWGIRGAGHNFGIVSSLTVKAYPQENEGMHWKGTLGFPGSKEMAGKVSNAIREMGISTGMGLQMIWARPPPAGFAPMIITNLWFLGSESDAKAAYAKLFELGPVMEICAPTPYNQINDSNDIVCIFGDRKPCWSTGLAEQDVGKLEEVWEDWVEWSGREGAGKSVVLTECYGLEKMKEVDEASTAYPWRDVGAFVLAIPMYESSDLDTGAQAFGIKFRAKLQGDGPKRVYTNFARGDEDPAYLYGGGERLEKLKALKSKWDPERAFGWYNPIC